MTQLRTAVPIVADRHFPVAAFAQTAQALAGSDGAVDDLQVWDQLTSWFPQGLWTTDRTPLASMMPDCDSFPDAFAMASYAAGVASGPGLVLSCDSVRRGPAELIQTMATIANLYDGQAIFQVGAGELKQTRPFGYKRSQGIKRLEDQYRILDALWEAPGTISYEGHYTSFDDAWIGGAKPHKPQIWGLGGGPQIIDLATSYAAGFCTMAPMVWNSPDEVAENIAAMKRTLEQKGRDPDAFGFGIWSPLLIHEDASVIDRALENDLMRWIAAIIGRINQGEWAKVGLDSPMPADWHYAMKLLPAKLNEAEAMEVVGRAKREHVEHSFVIGTSDEVAEKLVPFVEAGVTSVALLDILPFVEEIEDAMGAITRSIDVARGLKEKVGSGVAAAQ
jgi:phthiodiolone/phenolphthiodiolone dimycocerosates ketoreductase